MPIYEKRNLHDLSGESKTTVVGDMLADDDMDRPASGALERHKSRGEERREEQRLSQESIKASRAVAASYIFRPSKIKTPRTSAIGMRNNAMTLG